MTEDDDNHQLATISSELTDNLKALLHAKLKLDFIPDESNLQIKAHRIIDFEGESFVMLICAAIPKGYGIFVSGTGPKNPIIAKYQVMVDEALAGYAST